MPLGLLGAGAIMGGANILGGAARMMFQHGQNKRQRSHDLDMARLQHDYNKDSMFIQQGYNRENLALQQKYNLENWNRQNQYNDPSAQMQRLKNAGLNPHLVYGNGAIGNATGSVPSVSQPSVSSPQTKVNVSDIRNNWSMDFGQVANSIMQFQDLRLRQAQTDNVRANTEAANAEVALKIARESGVLTDNEKKKVELNLLDNLAPINVDTAVHKRDLAKQQVLNARRDELIKIAEQKIKQFEIKLNKGNLTKSDQIQWRLLHEFMRENGVELKPSKNAKALFPILHLFGK